VKNIVRIGIIICDRYKSCAGGKCLKAMKNRDGAFNIYNNVELELVGYTSCGGCPGGNIEYSPAEMLKNRADIIHFATGMVVGYPPCENIEYFKTFITDAFDIKVVVGTHPIPQNYYLIHKKLGTWDKKEGDDFMKPLLANEDVRLEYQ
jgi:predicted metal-binding protein